jgi:predicted membrane protein
MMRRGMRILLAVLMVWALAATVVHADGGATTQSCSLNIVWLCTG